MKKAFHFTSLDGMTNWKQDQGNAYDPKCWRCPFYPAKPPKDVIFHMVFT